MRTTGTERETEGRERKCCEWECTGERVTIGFSGCFQYGVAVCLGGASRKSGASGRFQQALSHNR